MDIPSLSHIFVLNVKAFTARRRFMEQQLAEVGMQAEFIFDWDKEDLNDEIIKRFFSTNNKLSDGQKSCALKHIVALQKVAACGGSVLVLEDDAVFAKDFKLGIQRALEQSNHFSGNKVIFIGSGGNFFTPKCHRISGQYLYVGHRGRFADSYIIDHDTARKRLEWIEQYKVSKPIDNQFDEIDKQLAIKIVWLEDPVVEQGSKNGLFKSQLESSPPLLLKWLFFRWEKLKRKHLYQLWK